MRRAALLVVLGLSIQGASLLWAHPTAFLTGSLIGVPVALVGVFLYLRHVQRERRAGR